MELCDQGIVKVQHLTSQIHLIIRIPGSTLDPSDPLLNKPNTYKYRRTQPSATTFFHTQPSFHNPNHIRYNSSN